MSTAFGVVTVGFFQLLFVRVLIVFGVLASILMRHWFFMLDYWAIFEYSTINFLDYCFLAVCYHSNHLFSCFRLPQTVTMCCHR
jgi:uncharacterized membrane protein